MKELDKIFPVEGAYFGISARDYIAIQAMTGLCANASPDIIERGFDEIADMAYKQEDEMIKRSEK